MRMYALAVTDLGDGRGGAEGAAQDHGDQGQHRRPLHHMEVTPRMNEKDEKKKKASQPACPIRT